MQDAIAQSVLHSILPAEVQDTYYPGETNCAKQASTVVVDNRFVQNFASLNGGSSTFTISPAQGISDIVCYFKMSSPVADVSGYALPQAFGYNLIKQVTVRYANSTSYIWTGEQLYLQNLVECEDGSKRDQMAQLAGNAVVGNACKGAESYVYINLPHNSPRASGKPLPFPSDLIVQPIVLQIELNTPASVFTVSGAGSAGAITTLDVAQLQVKQEAFVNSANLLANRLDMNENSLTYPLKYWAQQEQTITLQPSAIAQSLTLTGFKSGQIKSILMWLTKSSNDGTNGSHYYLPLSDLIVTYNGLQLYRADGGSNKMWSLIGDTKSAVVNTYEMNAGAWSAYVAPWVEVPMAQVNIPYDKEFKLMGGRAIMNAVLNVSLKTPTNASDYILHYVPLYDCALSLSRGGAEYVF